MNLVSPSGPCAETRFLCRLRLVDLPHRWGGSTGIPKVSTLPPWPLQMQNVLFPIHSLFRVIPADMYLDYFASDRSHMVGSRQLSPRLLSIIGWQLAPLDSPRYRPDSPYYAPLPS